MDFWSRLIAGTSLAPSKSTANNPEKRLVRFKQEYNRLLTLWRATINLSKDNDAAENVRSSIQELTNILRDETRRPLPHPCITFASEKQVYIPIGKIATTSYDEPIIREGVAFFATLIDSEEEDFVENDAFSKSLTNLLVRITGGNSVPLGSDTEVELVELSFNITTKIRLDPSILPAWFYAHGSDILQGDLADAHEKFTGKTHKEDFPLFYLLIDFIHHEGRTGDFARTGLLYIIEAASNSTALEQWIVESDLATLMATGLGALYSQLSRKLVIDHLPGQIPPILALSDYQHPRTTHEIVSSASIDFQGHMETFLSHLMFWQDVLNHCKSLEVKSTLLEHFQVIFLQQLLYPSLLESSDVDGGSSVAVLTYLRRILEALDHPDMIHLILHYLLALPDTAMSVADSKISTARKRKSMDLATMMATQIEATSTPALYNLVDLIQASLQSENQQTVSVTLQLVSSILRRHHRYAVTTLLWTSSTLHRPQRTVGAHEQEVDYLLSLAEDIGGDCDFEEIYENHVKDCMGNLESHPCSVVLVAPQSVGGTHKHSGVQATIPGAPRDIQSHTLRPEDPMLKTLLDILATFFINPIETNLSLTGTFIDLATCGYMRIDGWLLPDPAKYVYDEDEDSEGEVYDPFGLGQKTSTEVQEKTLLREMRKARRTPRWIDVQSPKLLQQLHKLVGQVSSYRSEIPRFEDILQQRRNAFEAAAAVPTSKTMTIQPHTSEPTPQPASPSLNAFDALAQRIFPELATPSRSRSPRGRSSQEGQRSGSSPNGGYGLGTPSRRGIAPPQLPMGLESPSGRASRDASTSSQGADEESRSRGVHAGQAAAFSAVDQSILARKMGLPSSQGEIHPIPFPDLTSELPETDRHGRSLLLEKEIIEERKEVSVSHVLTNVLVLQEFLLELAALVQVRASLFGEIRFT
ncbi:Retinoic acid induced 16-like protein-domain-containing protein [Calycina marina]|uniref:Retinoic acid induced 16-like protein-domain-containing protein n=1 Tax=Calycina marina TaxID=1763456 RepID=A0A9P8CHF0_9HELO|nr:Retinoic acid induced 16-like protein-domain-containing protein [Calycina marina]